MGERAPNQREPRRPRTNNEYRRTSRPTPIPTPTTTTTKMKVAAAVLSCLLATSGALAAHVNVPLTAYSGEGNLAAVQLPLDEMRPPYVPDQPMDVPDVAPAQPIMPPTPSGDDDACLTVVGASCGASGRKLQQNSGRPAKRKVGRKLQQAQPLNVGRKLQQGQLALRGVRNLQQGPPFQNPTSRKAFGRKLQQNSGKPAEKLGRKLQQARYKGRKLQQLEETASRLGVNLLGAAALRALGGP